MSQTKVLYNLLFILFIISCSDQPTYKRPGIIGKISDVVVVADKKVWEGSVGDSLRYVLSEPYPMLPQYEPQFDVRHLEPSQFIDYEKRAGTVFILSVGDKEQNREARVTTSKDTWATGQRVYTLYALTDTSFFRVLNKFKVQLLEELNYNSISRGMNYVRLTQIPYYTDLVKDRFGFDIIIPEGFNITVDKENVLCFQRRRERSLKLPQMGIRSHDIVDAIAIYKYNHDSDSTFTLDRQLTIRDSVLGNYIKSSSGMPISTEKKLYPTIKEIDFMGNYGVEIRGLWKFTRPLMGGPFISVNFFNEEEKYAVSVEGNVFAPKFDKRDYLREIESIIYSAQFVPDSSKTK